MTKAKRRAAGRTRPMSVEYKVYVRAEMTPGFVAVGPRGGFSDGTVPHFLKLRCLACGECTEKDVALYLLAPKMESCTNWYGAHRVTERCYPKCRNDAHLVRKCQCGRLGSVELTLPEAAEMEEDRAPVMVIDCVGYVPVGYAPGPGWVVTTTTGELMAISSTEGDTMKCFDEKSAGQITVGVVGFDSSRRDTPHTSSWVVVPVLPLS